MMSIKIDCFTVLALKQLLIQYTYRQASITIRINVGQQPKWRGVIKANFCVLHFSLNHGILNRMGLCFKKLDFFLFLDPNPLLEMCNVFFNPFPYIRFQTFIWLEEWWNAGLKVPNKAKVRNPFIPNLRREGIEPSISSGKLNHISGKLTISHDIEFKEEKDWHTLFFL